MNKASVLLFSALLMAPSLGLTAVRQGAELEVVMYEVSKAGIGEPIGTITAREHADGILFDPELMGLDPGLHGFHLHENPSCEPSEKDGEIVPAGAAGGHLNPDGEGAHNGPFTEGHRGDLPALYVGENGIAKLPVLAPRLEFEQVPGHALVIHRGGDNYSEDPDALGGGGARIACGLTIPD